MKPAAGPFSGSAHEMVDGERGVAPAAADGHDPDGASALPAASRQRGDEGTAPSCPDSGDRRPTVDADGQPDALECLEPLAAHTKRIERHQLNRRRGGRLRSDADRGGRANGGDHGDEGSQPIHTDSMRAIRRLET